MTVVGPAPEHVVDRARHRRTAEPAGHEQQVLVARVVHGPAVAVGAAQAEHVADAELGDHPGGASAAPRSPR